MAKITRYPSPTFVVTKNQEDSHQRNPSWVVAFVRFEEPASIYGKGVKNLQKTKDRITVIENDCISVTVTSSKGSFGKHASLNMKVGEIYYPNMVSPGDWVFVWMVDYQDDADKITKLLLANSNGNGKLNDWYSGLKFVGRIIRVDDVQSVSQNGVWNLVQSIQCQAFLEFATSIYYTYISKGFVTPTAGLPEGSTDSTTLSAKAKIDPQNQSRILINALLRSAQDLDLQFIKLFESSQAKLSPDDMIQFLFVMIFGVDREKINENNKARRMFNDAIEVPQQVSMILNRPSAKRLWELYNLYLGIQDYAPGNGVAPWEEFTPIVDVQASTGFNTQTGTIQNIFFRTNARCTGWIPFYPPNWENVNVWELLSRYVNSPFNEMYTALRCNASNAIVPTLVVREVPFGTYLYDKLEIGALFNLGIDNNGRVTEVRDPSRPLSDIERQETKNRVTEQTDLSIATFKAKNPTPSQVPRGMFHKLPRWIIDQSMVISINTSAAEVNRVNLVQVFCRRPGVEIGLSGISPEEYKQNQFAVGNYVVDDQDITRHGLRAVVLESPFDDPTQNKGAGLSPHLCKLKADHLFNGHLKTSGTITLHGVRWPIVEGDNIQVNGVVYHIDSVSHSGQIGVNGQKQFITTVSVSNGILAASLTGEADQLPSYPIHQAFVKREQNNLPGVTDIQRNIKSNRTPDGERRD
jgi:hypothetical protein